MSRRTYAYQWAMAVLMMTTIGVLNGDIATAKPPVKIAGQGNVTAQAGNGNKPKPNAPKLTDQQRATQEQIAARMKLVLQKFDANGNGRLEPAEEKAARAKLMQEGARSGSGRLGGPKVGGGGNRNQPGGQGIGGQGVGNQGFGDQGQGVNDNDQPTTKKKKKTKDPSAKQKLLAEFDADGNGKLDPDERKAAAAAKAKRKADEADAAKD